jgi:hypothetical protein
MTPLEPVLKPHLQPNPAFLKLIPQETRKIWANALRTTTAIQFIGNMYGEKDDNIYMCCLMVGHVAFGGDITTNCRGTGYPFSNSPFTKAMKGFVDPIIAIKEDELVTASRCQDDYQHTFEDIANLIEGILT